jgi:hypothetical protein
MCIVVILWDVQLLNVAVGYNSFGYLLNCGYNEQGAKVVRKLSHDYPKMSCPLNVNVTFMSLSQIDIL